ncbi:MAG TPA: head GIN domain-containing protein [Flavobacteriaceae bacterium]|nr:head GIN domain-containing protein [Flavobacteriaceae bacterium]
MKNRIILSLMMLCSLQLTAQSFRQVKGNGQVTTQERDLSDSFHAIHASNGIDVYLTSGEVASLKVEADENLHEIIVTEVSNGTLKITTNKNIGKSTKKKVYVTYIQLDNLYAEAGADIETKDILKSQKLDLLSNSGGDIDIEVFSEYITASASSGGDIELKGKSINIDANANSGGEVDAKYLEVLHANAKASSGGDVKVNAKETLKANADSGGGVSYYGNPKETDIQAGFSGRVKKKN